MNLETLLRRAKYGNADHSWKHLKGGGLIVCWYRDLTHTKILLTGDDGYAKHVVLTVLHSDCSSYHWWYFTTLEYGLCQVWASEYTVPIT